MTTWYLENISCYNSANEIFLLLQLEYKKIIKWYSFFKFQTVRDILDKGILCTYRKISYFPKESRLNFSREITDSLAEDNNSGNFCRRISTTSGSVNKVARISASLQHEDAEVARTHTATGKTRHLLSCGAKAFSLLQETLTKWRTNQKCPAVMQSRVMSVRRAMKSQQQNYEKQTENLLYFRQSYAFSLQKCC